MVFLAPVLLDLDAADLTGALVLDDDWESSDPTNVGRDFNPDGRATPGAVFLGSEATIHPDSWSWSYSAFMRLYASNRPGVSFTGLDAAPKRTRGSGSSSVLDEAPGPCRSTLSQSGFNSASCTGSLNRVGSTCAHLKTYG